MTRSDAADIGTQRNSGSADGMHEVVVDEHGVDVDRMYPSSRPSCRPGLQD